MKIHPVRAKLFHVERQTDMMKLLTVIFAILQTRLKITIFRHTLKENV